MRGRVVLVAGSCVVVACTFAACTSSAAVKKPSSRTVLPTVSTSNAPPPTTVAPSTTVPLTTASTKPSGSATATNAVRRPRTVTVLGSGDVLIHPELWKQAHADALAAGSSGYDFGPMYASIAPDVEQADLATCEMESPLALPKGPFRGWPHFSSPPQVLTALRDVGYDSCTTASNHTIDDGYAGVKRTLDEMDAAGIKHTGSARSASEAAKPLIMTMPNGVRIAQLAYTFGFNGQDLPAGESWLANRTNIPDIIAAAHRAKRDGADIVVLSMHWGTEYDLSETPLQIEQAHQLLASPDIDLILGDHPHVVEPAQRIHGKWVVYSMGNQISRHDDPVLVSREGAMPSFTFTEVSPGHFRVTGARVIPTLMQLSPALRLIDLPRALDDPTTSKANRATYVGAEADIRAVLDAMGAARSGLIVG